jgi:hypothetical protein
MSPTLPLPFGAGLDRYTGQAAVQPGSMADVRNVRPLRGKLQARRGSLLRAELPNQGGHPCTAVPLIQALQSQQEGVVVGYYAGNRKVHVFRTGATGVDPIHVGEWFELAANALEPPRFTAAESYGKAYITHDEPRLSMRAPTAIYNAFAGTVTELVANLDGTTAQPVRFRGVTDWRNYLVGWGFGTHEVVRPELVRVSLPGQPEEFDPEHYFIAGDRGSPVTTVRAAGSGLVAFKPAASFTIVGESHLNFGILPLYALVGCVGGRLAVTIEGRCYFWSAEGPRVTVVSDAGDLAPPLDLEGPDPADLPPLQEIGNGFAVYVPSERVIEWHFGTRIFSLSLDEEEGSKWGYRTRGFAAAGGGLLYSGSVPVGEGADSSPDTSPTGHAEIASATGEGSTATVEWDNVAQDGDEVLELWLREGAGAWAHVPPDTAVTLAASQSRGLTDLTIGVEHTVAVRYRRGGQYHQDYESSDPLEWPASSRETFITIPETPTLDSVEWARVSSSVERARVKFTVAPDHQVLQHEVFRDASSIGTVAAGVYQFDDTGITGETNHTYTVRALGPAANSALSGGVTRWMGPVPAHSDFFYTASGVGGCPGGQSAFDLWWTNGRPDLPTRLLVGGVPTDLDPGVDAFNGICSSDPPSFSIRHVEVAFGVEDFSPTVIGFEEPL